MENNFQARTYSFPLALSPACGYVVLSGPGIGSEVYRKVYRSKDKEIGQTIVNVEVCTEPIVVDDYPLRS